MVSAMEEMQKIIGKAAVLIEAMPYIQSFRGKTVVVKFGGSAMENADLIGSILRDVVFMHTVGMKPVLVHGGGARISAEMKKHGINPKFVEGYRVTTKEVIHIVKDALLDGVNADIVQGVKDFGAAAEGLAGDDSAMLRVTKFMPKIAAEKGQLPTPTDIGYVGEISSVDDAPINSSLERDAIPVIATLGIGDDGETYNINADDAAGEIALKLHAEKLVFVSNIHGVMRDPENDESLISSLHVSMVEDLMDRGIIQGGMIPKIKACIKAVGGGVHKTHVIDGRIPHSLLLEIFTDKGIGTQIVQ